MQERVSALRKPYLGAPIIISEGVLEGFYFGRRQAQDQVTGSMHANFPMGISTAQDIGTTPVGKPNNPSWPPPLKAWEQYSSAIK